MNRVLPLTALSAAFLLASPLVAQSGSASVEGVVRAQDDGSALSGASVEVVGASRGVLTDEAGRYILSGISSGTISLRFMRIGYTTLTKTVTLAGNETLVVDARLGTGPVRVDPIRVLLKRTRMVGDPLGAFEAPGAFDGSPGWTTTVLGGVSVPPRSSTMYVPGETPSKRVSPSSPMRPRSMIFD